MNKILEEMCQRNGVSITAGRDYHESLQQHIAYVQEAGRKLGVPESLLAVHDDSKFTAAEFPHYARQFHDGGGDDEGFARAWLHHENVNPHHWGYWIPRSGKYAGKPLEMPQIYVREMIADWMGANRAYEGTWNMAQWLSTKGPGLKLHESTATMIHAILEDDLGYRFTDNAPWICVHGPSLK